MLSVGMGWHSGTVVTHITEMGSEETLLSNRAQTGLVIEDNLCVRPGREAFVCVLELMA